jgi:hypothetical protein
MDSVSVWKSSPPVSLVVLDILIGLGIARGETEPIEYAPAVLFIIEKVPDIEISVGIDFDANTALLIIIKLAFIQLAVTLDIDASSFPLLPVDLSEVNLVVAFNQLEPGTREQLLNRHPLLGKRLEIRKILAKLILGQRPDILQGA